MNFCGHYAYRFTMIGFVLWLILFFLCWPLALIGLVLYPFIWLILLPFRLVGIAVGGRWLWSGRLLRCPPESFG